MEQYPRTRTWPYLLVVVALFVMAVFAPDPRRSVGPGSLAQARSFAAALGGTWPGLAVDRGGRLPSAATSTPPTSSGEERVHVDFRTLARSTDVLPLPAAPPVTRPETVERPEQTVVRPEPPSDQRSPAAVEGPPHFAAPAVVPEVVEPVAPDGSDQAPAWCSWPRPVTLIQQLEHLAARTPTRDWAQQTLEVLDRLGQAEQLHDADSAGVLNDLWQLLSEGRRLGQTLPEASDRGDVRRAAYAIHRRLDVWQVVHRLPATPPGSSSRPSDPRRLLVLIDAAERQLGSSDAGTSWQQFLLLSELRTAATAADGAKRMGGVAWQVVDRVDHARLDMAQRAVLRRGPIRALIGELRPWSCDGFCGERLLAELEEFESHPSPAAAGCLAKDIAFLWRSTQAEPLRLAQLLELHYRNANFRIAISDKLLNRLVPEQHLSSQPVRETILGASVSGQNLTQTQLSLRLIPTDHEWRMSVEAEGLVQSQTASRKGPVTFFSEGASTYQAGKPLQVDRQRGLLFGRAAALARSDSQLTGMESSYDRVPLIGWLVRNIAERQHRDQAGNVRGEVEDRVADNARHRLDQEVQQRLARAQENLQRDVVQPLAQLGLEPITLDMKTTADRVIARCRLAGDHQLAAYTARPRALDDSWLSLQVHQSALNNLLDQVPLHGAHGELRELVTQIARQMQLATPQLPEDLPEEVFVRLAEQDPVRVICADGHLRLEIRIAELATGDRRWRNFTVRGYYLPDPSQREADLVRDGSIELVGPRMGLRDQVALRGIFTRVLSRNQRLSLLQGRLAEHPKLADLRVTQFVVTDGWLGISVGRSDGRRERVASERGSAPR